MGALVIVNTCRSYYFALPNKQFEYIQAGIFGVGSNLSETAHIIPAYQIGVVVNPNNAESIANGICQLLNDSECYAQAKSNTVRAARVFDWQKESARLLTLYTRIEERLAW